MQARPCRLIARLARHGSGLRHALRELQCGSHATAGTMMKSLWNDQDAEQTIAAYAARGVARDLALRVYTTRLLGGDPRLVLHGGGNTSCKTVATDLVGETWEVLCVKGSGWDMGTIEPAGLPA